MSESPKENRKIIKKIERVFSLTISIPATIATLGLAILVLLVVIDVLLRHSLQSEIPGGVGFSSIILAMVVFFALGQAQAKKEHIRVEVFIDKLFLTKKVKKFLDLIIYLVAIIFFAVIFWESIDAFKISFDIKEYYGGARIRVPIYPARGALLIGCLIIIFQFIKDSIDLFKK